MLFKLSSILSLIFLVFAATANEVGYQGPEYAIFSCKMLQSAEGVETVAISTQKVLEMHTEDAIQVDEDGEYAYRNVKGVFEQTRMTRYISSSPENQPTFEFAKAACTYNEAWEEDDLQSLQIVMCRDNVYLRQTVRNVVGINADDTRSPFTAKLVLGAVGGLIQDREAEFCRWMRN